MSVFMCMWIERRTWLYIYVRVCGYCFYFYLNECTPLCVCSCIRVCVLYMYILICANACLYEMVTIGTASLLTSWYRVRLQQQQSEFASNKKPDFQGFSLEYRIHSIFKIYLKSPKRETLLNRTKFDTFLPVEEEEIQWFKMILKQVGFRSTQYIKCLKEIPV